jgi:hypothetical protein
VLPTAGADGILPIIIVVISMSFSPPFFVGMDDEQKAVHRDEIITAGQTAGYP